jgi:hypothetical protein
MNCDRGEPFLFPMQRKSSRNGAVLREEQGVFRISYHLSSLSSMQTKTFPCETHQSHGIVLSCFHTSGCRPAASPSGRRRQCLPQKCLRALLGEGVGVREKERESPQVPPEVGHAGGRGRRPPPPTGARPRHGPPGRRARPGPRRLHKGV